MSADIKLKWEWPADHSASDKLLIQVDKIKKQGSGLSGVMKSPSLAENLPEAQVLTGTVIDNDSDLNGKSLTLIVPLPEIEDIKTGSYAMLGIIDSSTCICIAPVEDKNTDLSSINCL